MSAIQTSLPTINYQWVESPGDLSDALNKGLIPLYKTCFSSPPYNEFYTDKDVCDIFENYKNKGSSILIAYAPDESVIGFSVKTPITTFPNGIELPNKNIAYCYGADLGIEPGYRRQGISTELESFQRDRMKDNYNIEITRTSCASYERIASNLKQGKRRMPFTQRVPMKRLDGTMGYDERVYFEFNLQEERKPADMFVNDVMISRVASSDMAFVLDQNACKNRKKFAPLIKDNYPGLTEIFFADDKQDTENVRSFARNGSTIIFDGSMPLNNPTPPAQDATL